VANEFGSRDIGFTAHETPAGQMLLLSEHIVLEALDLDGNPVPPGAMGEAVLTALCSEAQPFIRYRTGDMVRLGGETCSEGRGLHVIDEVVGRSTDFVVRADGTIMHASPSSMCCAAWMASTSSRSSSTTSTGSRYWSCRTAAGRRSARPRSSRG